jgi:streptomycin 6-kinase
MIPSNVPELDHELRRRLRRRYGDAIDDWLDALPPVLTRLAGRWGIEWGSLIQRGNMSVVIRCRTADGREAVLKVTPDRERIAHEAVALEQWTTAHVPAVLAVDEREGALLIEAIEPGTPLAESESYPPMDRVSDLLAALHKSTPDPRFRPVADRVAYLFDAGLINYDRRPELAARVPRELYERGRRRALELAADPGPTVLLHGDLTAVNVLDGGSRRGLVAIDPAPCVGDPAFDAVDLVFWRAEDVETIADRADRLGRATAGGTGRLLQWCAAFAPMVALELADRSDSSRAQIDALLAI